MRHRVENYRVLFLFRSHDLTGEAAASDLYPCPLHWYHVHTAASVTVGHSAEEIHHLAYAYLPLPVDLEGEHHYHHLLCRRTFQHQPAILPGLQDSSIMAMVGF
jgi:hypothetical protein